MVRATDISSTNRTQDQMTGFVSTDTEETDLLEINSPSSVDTLKFLPTPPSSSKPTKSRSISVGVGRDSDVENTPKQQTKTDQYVYTGDIYAEKKHGNGILSWSDGRIFTGTFFADKRHGFGVDHTPNISEFKGLYCHDERFGPGILIYKSLHCADVGLWLGDRLIRLLHPHPHLQIELQITSKKVRETSSMLVPSWYSPKELLTTLFGFNFLSKKKSTNLFISHIGNDQTHVHDYLHQHLDRIRETMPDKYAQLDAYLSSLGQISSKEKVSHERPMDIPSPNDTYEQQQLFRYINKFWPFKQRALFPIDDIVSNLRSSFPNPGPLENASLRLFESSFHGHEKDVRDLLNERLVYVDVCDCQGLTSLHFGTYNAHLNIINLLLDFGGNVNQLSDDGLTPLGLAFLLYYGNNLYQTVNIAFEHSDPLILNPRTPTVLELNSFILSKPNLFTSSSYFTTDTSIQEETRLPSAFDSLKINDRDQKSSYGFQLTDALRERIRKESFHQLIHSVILLLLRRGADPSFSDWPMPVLALAVRSDDIEMVKFLIEKQVQVNCQLNSNRHANLTPLHIACGSTSPNALEIARYLLEHGANVNARTSPGNNEYLSLIDPLIIDSIKINENEQQGRTSLHIACTREESIETLDLVRNLLTNQADPNAVCNGQTPLTLAIIRANQPLIDLLLNHETTDPSTPLGFGNGNALCTVLSTFHETQWTYTQRLELIQRIIAKNPKVLYPVRFGPKNTLGSCVDYAHYMFAADTRISQTPFHSLATEDRAKFSERKELLAFMAKRFREEMTKHEELLRSATEISLRTPSPTNTPSRKSFDQWKISGEFRYCATCGRSTGIRLTVCKRCQKTYFCSKQCKIDGWSLFHRYQCRQLSSPIQMMKNSSRVKSPTNFDRFLTLKTPPKPTNKTQLPPIPLSKYLRQRRSRNRHKIPTHALDGSELSWNSTYNAPENYSFN